MLSHGVCEHVLTPNSTVSPLNDNTNKEIWICSVRRRTTTTTTTPMLNGLPWWRKLARHLQ
jgi:hypothetical protein